MAQAQRTGRSRHRLILLALTAITLLTVDLNGFGPAESVQRGVRDVLNPITSLATTVLSPIGDAWNSVFNYGDLEAENEALRAEIEALKGSAIRGEADTETLRRLLAATDLPYVGDLDTVTAQVVRGSVGNFDDHVVTIDKGSRHGLEVDMAVVTAAGMVGRVSQVDNSTAQVQLLSDDDLFVGVRLVSTDQVGLGHAIAGQEGMFVIDQGMNYPDSDDPTLLPEVGSAVVTAGVSSYPADIPIGVITEIGRAVDEVTMRVEVELANDVDDLQFVSVVLQVAPEEFPLDPTVTVPTDGLAPDADDPDATGEDG
ncbi:MAG: rod shape-determining protein MreC [Acidimicrobiales bacterium]|nr:rod shape-determining protein MreC [Acidimicrobiales bacterium]